MNKYKISYYNGNDVADSLRINLQLDIYDKNKTNKIKFLLDTGASGVTLTSDSLKINESEQTFVKQNNLKPYNRFGILKSAPVIYYRYIVDELRLGPFILKEFPVNITFNPDVTTQLLGMTFLRLFQINTRPQYKVLTFEEIEEYKEYTSGVKSCKDIDRNKNLFETYIDFENREITAQDLIANYINRMVEND